MTDCPVHHETPSPECIEATGPFPFVTHRVYRQRNGLVQRWHSRHHRKQLRPPEEPSTVSQSMVDRWGLWLPNSLNWWIGLVFAVGALLFSTASIMVLGHFAEDGANLVYFLGSIPFTVAAYLQLFQAANTDALPDEPDRSHSRRKLVGWRPHDVGWLSCALQFVGTILFNFNTFDAMLPSLNWFQTDLLVWVPNFVGSILFLASGYLAYAEVVHQYVGWKPRNLSWWIVFINLLGCIGFMVSAVLAFGLPGPPHPLVATLSVVFTLQGAICFFLGALLMWPEAAQSAN
ncbi:hypothetical protein ACYFX5_02820 [Bremerella sp. T1]|uniref:hypothetical protein n=1 Tax=Bremerella sp. TYQ1 TaxID=3119568 RepID=UPI001CCD4DB9|nr:hypothetical protein [Bremerella volcania]UBM37203.1 hypothetical protein LA756_04775 [Bremerella volcania]